MVKKKNTPHVQVYFILVKMISFIEEVGGHKQSVVIEKLCYKCSERLTWCHCTTLSTEFGFLN